MSAESRVRKPLDIVDGTVVEGDRHLYSLVVMIALAAEEAIDQCIQRDDFTTEIRNEVEIGPERDMIVPRIVVPDDVMRVIGENARIHRTHPLMTLDAVSTIGYQRKRAAIAPSL